MNFTQKIGMTGRSGSLSRWLGLVVGFSLVALLSLWSSRLSIARDDQDDEREFRRVEARRSFVENCLMCHGEDMTSRQRLTAKQWTAEVEKMVNWGAPLPPDRKQPLIEHLAETYPSTQPPPAVERISAARLLELHSPPQVLDPLRSANLARGEALFAIHCATCHGPTAKGGELGVNLVEKPPLLRETEFRTLLRQGLRRMPGFAAVLDDQAQTDLLAWLRRQR